MRNLLLACLTVSNMIALAQKIETDLEKFTPKSKRFIDKVEVFGGPNLSFNRGNMFIENYKDANVQNKRLTKVGYCFGLGLYHPISDRIDLNVRAQYEWKGTKNELNTPLTSDARAIDFEDYTYNYLTFILAPQISIGEKRRCFFSLGAYYSKIKGMTGHGRTYNTLDNQVTEGHYKGRFFEHLRSDGGVDSFTWVPGLQSFEPSDYGASITIAYSIPIKEKQSITIQMVDNFGLKNINKDNPYGLEEKNHTICLMLGYVLQRSNNNLNPTSSK